MESDEATHVFAMFTLAAGPWRRLDTGVVVVPAVADEVCKRGELAVGHDEQGVRTFEGIDYAGGGHGG